MGKKKNKSGRYDDDDIFGGPLPTNQEVEPHNEDDNDCRSASVATATNPSATETNVEDTASPPPTVNSETKGGNAKQKVANIDLIKLEETMIDVLRNHRDKSDNWLYRTIEKNMHLPIPKHSLRQHLDPVILEDMMSRVQQTLDQEEGEEESKKRTWDALVAEMSQKSELSEKDKAKLWAGARELDVDQEEAVAMVVEAIRNVANKRIVTGPVTVREDKPSLPISILLYLYPHTEPSDSLLGKIRQFIFSLIFAVGSNLLGHQVKTRVKRLYESIHLPAIKAAQQTKEKEEDEYMLQANTHLWSNETQCWVEKDATYSHPPTNSTPSTIRCNGVKWERWSKNLKTRTKAMKLAEAQGIPMPAFSRGTFVPVRAGEGWATAPTEPEVETDQIMSAGIRFLTCLPSVGGDGTLLDVVDVTSWAMKSLLSKEAARQLGAVDSGRELFSFDVSSLQLRNKGKAKNNKKKRQNKTDNVDKEEENKVARKGLGFTAKVSKKYLDQMERDLE